MEFFDISVLLSFLGKILVHDLGIIFNAELDEDCLKNVFTSQAVKLAISIKSTILESGE